jgi:hypothetical protein
MLEFMASRMQSVISLMSYDASAVDAKSRAFGHADEVTS